MSAKTGIQWTDATWNPVVGCTKVSQGCKHCYAKTLHDMRHKAHLAGKKVAPQYGQPFETVQLMPERLYAPLSWRKPRRVFVNSVSDLFHEDVPMGFIAKVWAVMALAPRHTYQILTKRPARMLAVLTDPSFYGLVLDAADPIRASRAPLTMIPISNPAHAGFYPQVWLGVSVENQAAADERIPLLLQAPAAVRFLSCEPLIGPVDLGRFAPFIAHFGAAAIECEHGYDACPICDRGIDWVIVGGESGANARVCDLSWVTSIVANCQLAFVPVFVKQLGRWIAGESSEFRTINTWWLKPDAPRGRTKFDPSHAVAFSLCDSHGGDMAEWPERLRVREFPDLGRTGLVPAVGKPCASEVG